MQLQFERAQHEQAGSIMINFLVIVGLRYLMLGEIPQSLAIHARVSSLVTTVAWLLWYSP